MMFNDYINENFLNLKLRSPLFYNWRTGIRFELGNPDESNEKQYMERVYQRSLALFKSLHSLDDELLIVVNVHHSGEKKQSRRKLKVFNHYINSKDVLFRLKHTIIPYVFEDVHDIYNIETHRYTLFCKVSDLKYHSIIKAICNQDMNIKPKINHDVFFINTNNNTIFHIYDDRGCDVIALDKEEIRHLYQNFNDWILDYDRLKVDKLFC